MIETQQVGLVVGAGGVTGTPLAEQLALDARPDARLAIIANTLDAVESAAPGFANLNLMQGTKYYGSYLGPFKTPAKESDPRILQGDFYYSEEDLVTERQRGKRWTWTAVRPTAVCGYAPGNPVNLPTVRLPRLAAPGTQPTVRLPRLGRLLQVADSGDRRGAPGPVGDLRVDDADLRQPGFQRWQR